MMGSLDRRQIPADIVGSYLQNLDRQSFLYNSNTGNAERKEEIEVFLHLCCKQDGRKILFANTSAENGVLLGTFR